SFQPRRWLGMNRRSFTLGLILLTLLVTAAKLRATPKYDSIQLGMTDDGVEAILSVPASSWARPVTRGLPRPAVYGLRGTCTASVSWILWVLKVEHQDLIQLNTDPPEAAT